MKTKWIPLIAAIAAATTHFTSAATFYGVTVANELITFDSSIPGTFLSNTPITGLFESDGVTPDSNAVVTNLSFNLFTGQFLAIDSNANIYNLSTTGEATLLNSTFSPAGFNAGFAYDPFNNNFVYAGDNTENFSISIIGVATVNPNFTYAAGGTPAIFGLGIDPFLGTAFAIDALNDSLSTSSEISFPVGSELNIVGGLGVDVTAFGGLVVDLDGNLYASLSEDGVNSSFYSIDSTTGAATLVGAFSNGVGTMAIPEPSAALLAGLGVVGFIARRRRK
jgi:hypothetical protein